MRFLKRLDDFLLAAALIILADVVLFHAGAYFPWLQPDSFSGMVERQARRAEHLLETAPDGNRIVVMGNSMTRAGVREALLEEELAARGLQYQVVNISIGGSSPRAWYVLLDDGRFIQENTQVVVLGVNAESFKLDDRDRTRTRFEVSKTRLKVSDAVTLARGYKRLEDQLEVFSRVIFRTPLFRQDLRQFLESPAIRRRAVEADRARFEERKLAGARVDNDSKKDLRSARLGERGRLIRRELDPFLKKRPALQRQVQDLLRLRQWEHQLASRGKTRKYKPRGGSRGKIEMLNRLIDELNREGIQVVLCVLPANPYLQMEPPEVQLLKRFFRNLKKRGADVKVWYEPRLLNRLKGPAYFKDVQHLNAHGAELYTRRLARYLTRILAEPSSREAGARPAGRNPGRAGNLERSRARRGQGGERRDATSP